MLYQMSLQYHNSTALGGNSNRANHYETNGAYENLMCACKMACHLVESKVANVGDVW